MNLIKKAVLGEPPEKKTKQNLKKRKFHYMCKADKNKENSMNIVTQNSNSVVVQWDQEKIQLLKDMFGKELTSAQLDLFGYVCKRTGLDPFIKQIYPVVRKQRQPDGSYKPVMTIQTGIDGYRLISERTGKYAPGREPTYTYDQSGNVKSATAYIKKQTDDGTWHEIAATAYWEEYVQRNKDGKPTDFWSRMPHNQLAKCAEALAHKKANPADLTGIYTSEEMQQADNPIVDSAESQEQEKDFTREEIEDYINKKSIEWDSSPAEVEEFVEFVRGQRNWTYRLTFSSLDKNPEYTISQYMNWLKKKMIA